MTDNNNAIDHTDPYISTENETMCKEDKDDLKVSLLENADPNSLRQNSEQKRMSLNRVLSRSETTTEKAGEIYQNRLFPSSSCQFKKTIQVQPILKKRIKDKKVVKNENLASHPRKDLFGNDIADGTKKYSISFKNAIADVKEVESYKEYNAEEQEEPCICKIF